jgi:hypothetical protein
MQIAQRGTSFAGLTNGSGDTRTLDGWKWTEAGATSSVWTVSQESSGGVNGKSRWIKSLCTTEDAAPAANDEVSFKVPLEGNTLQSLVSDAGKLKESVISFDIIAHADGSSGITFPAVASFALFTEDGTKRQIILDVTIQSIDTWERVSVVIPADSVAEFNNDTGEACRLQVNIGSTGTDYESTGGVWANFGGATITTNTDNWGDQANNYLGFTNVKWEAGAVATPFAYRTYAEELESCKRYYNRLVYAQDEDIVTSGYQRTTATADAPLLWSPEMRASPTITDSSATGWNIQTAGGHIVTTSVNTTSAITPQGFNFVVSDSGTGLTPGDGCVISSNGAQYLELDAEL